MDYLKLQLDASSLAVPLQLMVSRHVCRSLHAHTGCHAMLLPPAYSTYT